ncbi:ScbA/BarX family gamma-butyrolactone biosynthesis protein [Planomonospora algeriensis]
MASMQGADEDPHLFERTVPRRLVHRAAISEVMLTDWRAVDGETFLLGAQWPRTHPFYTPANGMYDPLLLAETFRQAGLLISHAEFGVPYGHQFLMRDLWYEANPESLTVGSRPLDLMLRFTCHEVRRKGARLAGMRFEVDLYRDDEQVGRGGSRFDCVSPSVYTRLRAGCVRPVPVDVRLPAPVAPAHVGRDRASDVLLSPTAQDDVWELRIDTGHPILFDHEVDHVPGMVLMEAMRQAAHLLCRPGMTLPVRTDLAFHRYVELGDQCSLSAFVKDLLPNGDALIRMSIEQYGSAAVTGSVTARPLH